MFNPDIVHSHHPFLLGSIAKRLSDTFKVPLVFTHHTMYEQYSYVVGTNPLVPTVVASIATKFANSCDLIFAPSQSTHDIIRARGVDTPIKIIPTGVDVAHFASGDGRIWRAKLGIPMTAPVVGYVGRLAPEKNLSFLLDAIKRLLLRSPTTHFILVGDGPSAKTVREALIPRMHMLGSLSGLDLVHAYSTMNTFAFSSLSETQGMVLVEAMAAGVPVVALDGPGVRDVVIQGINGYIVPAPGHSFDLFVEEALGRWRVFQPKKTAEIFSQRACAERAIAAYSTAQYQNKGVVAVKRLLDWL